MMSCLNLNLNLNLDLNLHLIHDDIVILTQYLGGAHTPDHTRGPHLWSTKRHSLTEART